MQDEVHNYTINYHRTIRSKGSISSVLDNIYGIGAKRKKELIKKYGSVSKMKEASIADLETILPSDVAKNLYDFLKDFK
jgi:excinuclease ABC subunit C